MELGRHRGSVGLPCALGCLFPGVPAPSSPLAASVPTPLQISGLGHGAEHGGASTGAAAPAEANQPCLTGALTGKAFPLQTDSLAAQTFLCPTERTIGRSPALCWPLPPVITPLFGPSVPFFPALWLSCSPRQSHDVLTTLPCSIPCDATLHPATHHPSLLLGSTGRTHSFLSTVPTMPSPKVPSCSPGTQLCTGMAHPELQCHVPSRAQLPAGRRKPGLVQDLAALPSPTFGSTLPAHCATAPRWPQAPSGGRELHPLGSRCVEPCCAGGVARGGPARLCPPRSTSQPSPVLRTSRAREK